MKPMKLLKITIFSMLITAACVFIYANARRLSPVDRLKPVTVASFSILGLSDPEKEKFVHEKVSATIGVTACKINGAGNVASVIYHADVISEKDLQRLLSNAGPYDVDIKTFKSTGGGCPVHQVGNTFQSFINTLDLRIK
jgi:hypothetical protein